MLPASSRRNSAALDGVIDEMEIEKGKPVWVALSELWLDMELTHYDLLRIARAAGLRLRLKTVALSLT